MSSKPFLTPKHPDTHIELSMALEQLRIFLQGTEILCLGILDKRIPQTRYSMYVNSAAQYNQNPLSGGPLEFIITEKVRQSES